MRNHSSASARSRSNLRKDPSLILFLRLFLVTPRRYCFRASSTSRLCSPLFAIRSMSRTVDSGKLILMRLYVALDSSQGIKDTHAE